jgi:hypothetical protein
MSSLERKLLPADVARALTRHEIVTARIAELDAIAASMTPAQFDSLLDAQNELTMRRNQLRDAGRLDLIGGAA